ncbi:plasmid replication, integration and excision activator [Jiangella anatolica]|uniref:Plasmid replication, integration and excision activator n=1 Tax=Jiangella anatolica TaxID=2670374 RepID=A0A2W2CA96_9ACTN|nr:plasmid replication, integration and excision activator [Jiangella anatolica]PZF85167.1 plasmid replication, integration and excision activator [Jiangella anatolica]
MALQGRIPVTHDMVFPHGAMVRGEVTQVDDFDQSTKDNRVQEIDKVTKLRVWQVRVDDLDPEARKGQDTITVKILADVCPSLPDTIPGLPFRPVEFTGMTVTPYVDERGTRRSIAYSFRATGVQAPSKGARKSGENQAA